MASMNNCGGSTRPETSGERVNIRYWPSGDHRGAPSRGPLVSCRVSPSAVETVQIAVLYASFFSLTVTRTNATREPSGDTCGSPIQTKLKRSFSVMLRFCASTGAARDTTMSRKTETRKRMCGFLSIHRLHRLPRLSRLATQIDVINHATIVVRQEKCIFAEAENVCRAAVDDCPIEKSGDEVGHRAARC